MPPEIPITAAAVNDGILVDGELYVITAVDPATSMFAAINVKLKDSDPSGAITTFTPVTMIQLVAPGAGPAILVFPVPPQ